MNKIRNLVKDRRGSTLIEIIISVLIVGIAFVPLMMGLHAAMTANRQTEKELYAENVAANVAEICKTFGKKGLEEMCTATEESKKIGALLTDAEIGQDITNSNRFVISNITSGTKERYYTATVRFDKSAYEAGSTPTPDPSGTPSPTYGPKQNDFSGFPSLAGISGACFATFAEDSLDDIVNWFYDQAVAGSADLGVITKDSMKNNISKWLKREFYVTLNYDTSSGEYKVGKYIRYIGINDPYAEIMGSQVFGSETHPADYIAQQKDDVGVYTTFPDNIVLTYKPLRNAENHNLPLRAYDSIIVVKNCDGILNVYSLCESGSTIKSSPSTMTTTLANVSLKAVSTGAYLTTSDPEHNNFSVRIYNNLWDSATATETCYRSEQFGEGGTTSNTVMKDVIIEISDENGLILDKKTTVIEIE
ncbi:MAG: hypothetical protein K6E47_12170 [Lachnospiraceae bacterium]|nr:hypothetical protein [Lachnospiraceae bacterium]